MEHFDPEQVKVSPAKHLSLHGFETIDLSLHDSIKARGMIAWMGNDLDELRSSGSLAMMVSTRLWLAGVVSQTRDSTLADRLLQQVCRCSQTVCALLICTDGWPAYPNSIRRAKRSKVKRTAGRGRCSLEVWSGLHIGTVIKRTVNHCLKEVLRQMAHGSLEQAHKLLQASKGGTMLNTSFIERLNGTMRERLAALTRKCRHASSKLQAFHTGMYLIGCTSNFCVRHDVACVEWSRSSQPSVQGCP